MFRAPLVLKSPYYERLKKRALKSLSNPSEIDDEVIELAINESNEACKGRDVAGFVRLDFAYVRLKLHLKIALNGEDELLFNNALKAIEKAPLMNENGEFGSSVFYQSALREERY